MRTCGSIPSALPSILREYRMMGYGLPATCPSAHTGDTPKRLCTAMCQSKQAALHCTWCKCSSCAFCQANVSSDQFAVLHKHRFLEAEVPRRRAQYQRRVPSRRHARLDRQAAVRI